MASADTEPAPSQVAVFERRVHQRGGPAEWRHCSYVSSTIQCRRRSRPRWAFSIKSHCHSRTPQGNERLPGEHKLNSGADRDISGFDHFREFANFLEGVGLPAEWSPYFNGPDRPQDQPPGNQQSRATSATPDPSPSQGARLGTPFSCWLPSAPATNGHRVTSYAQEHSKQHTFWVRRDPFVC